MKLNHNDLQQKTGSGASGSIRVVHLAVAALLVAGMGWRRLFSKGSTARPVVVPIAQGGLINPAPQSNAVAATPRFAPGAQTPAVVVAPGNAVAKRCVATVRAAGRIFPGRL